MNDKSRIAHSVVIAGAGPTGLMLAAELALAGVEVAIVERRGTAHVEGARATPDGCSGAPDWFARPPRWFA